MIRCDQLLLSAEPTGSLLRKALGLRAALRHVADSEIFVAGDDELVARLDASRKAHLDESMGLLPISTLSAVRRSRPEVLLVHAEASLPLAVDLIPGLADQIVLVHHAHNDRVVHDAEQALLAGPVQRVLAPSAFEAEQARALGARDVRVATPPMFFNHLLPDHADPTLFEKLLEGRQAVVALGDPGPGHHVEAAIAAVALAQLGYELDVNVVVLGSGDRNFELALGRWAHELGLGERLVLAGDVTPAERCAWFRWACMALTFSPSGGLDVDLLDAMAAGVPIIARDHGAVREQLGGGGLLLPADAGPSLAGETIGQLWTDTDLRVEVAISGHHALSNFASDDGARQVLDALDGLL